MDVVGVNVFRTWKCWQWCLCRTKTTFPMFDDALAWDLKLFIFFVSHEKFYWTRKPSVAQERHLLTFAIHELTTTLRNIHGIRHHPLSFSSLVTEVHSQLSNPVETAARWSSREYREFQGMSYQGVWTSSYSRREQGGYFWRNFRGSCSSVPCVIMTFQGTKQVPLRNPTNARQKYWYHNVNTILLAKDFD